MTEKRYGLTYDNQIFDNLISDPITNERAVELLNNSLKRINALRKENKELQRHVDVMRSGALTDDRRIKELYDENEQLKQEIKNLRDFRGFITEKNVENGQQRKELQLQMLRLYNYFENWFEDTMSPTTFSEMWDNVKEDVKWEKKVIGND